VSDREKTIADSLASPDWVGGIRHLVEMLETYFADEKPAMENLLKQMMANGRGAAYKRIGYLVDELWPEHDELRHAALANKTRGNVKLDPGVAIRGRLNKRWGVWSNVALSTKDSS
jgi:predicted transcriptional regulator of viral defense system